MDLLRIIYIYIGYYYYYCTNLQFVHFMYNNTLTCTLKGRVQTVTKSNQPGYFPGPFDYHSEKKTDRAPTYVIGKQARDVFKVKQTNPGPGSYEAPSSIRDGPRKSFGSRLDKPIKQSPGPQDYQPEKIAVKSAKMPQYSISKKSKSFHDIIFENNLYKPSPGSYETKDTFNNQKIVIGTSVRKDLTQTQKTPGPGSYLTIDQLDKSKTIEFRMNPRWSIGTNPRKMDIEPLLENPGPGTYEKASFCEQNKAKLKGYTLRPKTTDLIAVQKSKIPGPGTYQFNLSNKRKAPQYSTSSNKRATFIDEVTRQKLFSPPPGTHDANFDMKFRTTTSFKFGNSNRKPLDQKEKTPGPSQYNNQKHIILKEAPKFSLPKSNLKLEEFFIPIDSNPGPGQYQPNLKLAKDSITVSQIPHQERPNYQKAKLTPGPGNYNLRGKQEGPTWKFGSQIRKPFTDRIQKTSNEVEQVGQGLLNTARELNNN